MVLNTALALAAGASIASLDPSATVTAMIDAGAALALTVLLVQVVVVAWRDATDTRATHDSR